MGENVAPPGWYQQPDGRLRRWDGKDWTDEFQNLPVVAPPTSGWSAPTGPPAVTETVDWSAPTGPPAVTYPVDWSAPTGPPASDDPMATKRNWFMRHKILGALGLIAIFAILVNLGSGGGEEPRTVARAGASSEPTPSAASSQPSVTETAASATPSPTPPASPSTAAPTAQAQPYGPQPKNQRAVVTAIVTAQAKADDADNDLQRGGVLRSRTRAICAAMPSMKVQNWAGRVGNLDANSDGKGVVGILIADGAEVTTWNNSFSDIGDETLIEPDSKLFDQVMALEEDQLVQFSGTFLRDEANCLKESSLTLSGNLSTPSFIFRFSTVTPLK